jgi:class 3 adenylate cyclase
MPDQPAPEEKRPPAHDAAGLSERVADGDRDHTVTILREHVVDGRLTLDEFSERVGRALEAKTRGDLEAVMADLPAPAPPSATVPEEAPPEAPRKQRRWHIAVLSGHSTKGRWRISGKTNAVAVMGGCDLDLRRAEIAGPEVSITAFTLMGGIQIVVPEGFEVDLRGFSFMGGRDLKLRDVPRVPGSPTIVVRAFAIMGGIEVKSRSSRSRRELSSRSRRQRSRTVSDRPLGAVTPVPPVPPPPPVPPVPSFTSVFAAPPGAPPNPLHDHTATFGADMSTDGTVTILFCDMVDYAGMTERLGDQASRRLLHEHHRIVRDALVRHGGREISVQGDGFMTAFGGAARAMRCAVDIQRAFHDYLPPGGGDPIEVHIGIHTGDALDEGDDFLGHTVIVASRLADAAAPGEILVSSLSEQLVQGSGEFVFGGHRETQLKGMARPQLSATLNWAG